MSIVLMPMVSHIAIAAAAAEKHLFDQLRAAGATTSERAIPLAIRDDLERERQQSLGSAGILVQQAPGRYFLDEGKLSRRSHVGRRTIVLTLVLLVATLGGLAALLATR